MRRRSHVIALAAVLVAASPAAARATQSASISAGFSPKRLGAPTTLQLGFRIAGGESEIPSPLTGVDLSYPRNLGIATSGLGTATCQQVALEEHGPAVCPGNSRMGSGTALARFRIGPEVFEEGAGIAIVAGPPQEGFVRLLISATGTSPVAARIVMSTLLVPGHLQIGVPLVPSLPEGEDVSVVRVRATLGGNLVYRERRRGRTISYRPRGISLPKRCPRGGFRFAARFSFLDGSGAVARTVVACPARRGR